MSAGARPMLSRRTARAGGAGDLVATLLAGASADERAFATEAARASEAVSRVGRDRLWLKRATGTEVEARFRDGRGFDGDRAVWIEPRLFDLVAAVQSSMSLVHGNPLLLVLLSGYRTPAHNAILEAAARNSMHPYGYAADLRAPG